MEITSENYWESLPGVLEAVAAATYVSVDLEMTGLYSKNTTTNAKTALNAIYEQAKEASERFQIVQFGLSCISYHKSTKEYRAKTFNFLLTPSFTGHRPVDKRLAQCVDRYVGFSQSSIMFLRDHDFHMDQAFKHGVSYLSQSETQELGGKFLQTFDKLDPTDRLVLTDYDQQAIDFYNHAMNIINHWYTSKPREEYCNITNPHGGRLNALQVRIVSELVQDQYSNCRTFPRNNRAFMQVVLRNPTEDEEFAARMLAEREDAINRQKGFSFVMEALMGLDFLDTLPIEYLIHGKVADRQVAIAQMAEKLKRLQDKLTTKQRPILIGHNSLYDLCFIYHSFHGPLPSTIEEFGGEIRHLFPKIVDTKFLARRKGNHSMLADDTLAELFQSAMKLCMPRVIKDPDMPEVVRGGYGAAMTAHQAGYDSWMTAVVFLRYAWGLVEKAKVYKSPTESEKARTNAAKEQNAAVMKQLGEAISNMDFTSATDVWAKHHKYEQEHRAAQQASGSDPELAQLLSQFPAPPAPSYGTMQPNTSWLFDEPDANKNNTSLLDFADAGIPGWEPLVPDGALSPIPDLTACLNSQPLREGLTTDCESVVQEGGGVLPGWDRMFWRAYGNKIRVRTVGVLDLDQCERVNEQ